MRISNHVQMVFDQMNIQPDDFKNLLFDLGTRKEIYNAETDRIISKAEADEKVLTFVHNVLGIDKNSTKKQIRRAKKAHLKELYEVLEDVIDFKTDTGFHESEFFNELVEMRNLSRGDSQEFWSDNDVILSISKVSGDHHDFILQTLGEGESYTVNTSVYGAAVGTDIDLYLMGRRDWATLTDKIAEAFVIQIQNEIYAEVMNAGEKLPVKSQFNKTMAIEKANKDTFDTLIEDVSMANGNAEVYIMGTRTALKKLTAFADIDWISEDQKKEVASMGRLGSYEGTTLIEIPQRFANNDVTKKLVDSKKLLIMAKTEDKFVKFVDVGDTEILETTEKGARMDDTMKYEVQREMGIYTQISRYFGVWNIA